MYTLAISILYMLYKYNEVYPYRKPGRTATHETVTPSRVYNVYITGHNS